MLNAGAVSASVQLKFFGTGGVVSRTATVSAGMQSILSDVVGEFGVNDSGAVEVISDQPLKVTARSYNLVSSSATCYADGTQGQDYPALAAADGLSATESAYLTGLTENSARTHCNIGVVNAGSEPATALVELFDGDGTKLHEYTVGLAAGQWSQVTQPFLNYAGQTAMDSGYAEITVLSGSGVFAFASLVDNVTNDPTTVAMQGSAPASVAWVPVASHGSGKNSSQWRSDLGVLNPGTAPAEVQITFHGGGGALSTTATVPGGAQSILADVVGQLGGNGSGPLEVSSDQPLVVTSRTYNRVAASAACYPDGTQGQDYPAVPADGGLSAGQSAYLPGLTENAAYHCNIGLVNTGAGSATALVELYDEAGVLLKSYSMGLPAGQWAQVTQPFLNYAGQTAMDRGYAKVTVESGSGVFAFASVVDNITNDPTTVAMQR